MFVFGYVFCIIFCYVVGKEREEKRDGEKREMSGEMMWLDL